MRTELILQVHAPLLRVPDTMLAFWPDLTCAIAYLRQWSICTPYGIREAVGKWVVDEILRIRNEPLAVGVSDPVCG